MHNQMTSDEMATMQIRLSGYAKTLHMEAIAQADFIGEEIAKKITPDRIHKAIGARLETALSSVLKFVIDTIIQDALTNPEFVKTVRDAAMVKINEKFPVKDEEKSLEQTDSE